MRKILLISVLILVPMLAWSLWWWQQSTALKQRVAENITVLNQRMTLAGSHLHISYDGLASTHFYGRPHVKVMGATLSRSGLRSQQIKTSALIIEPEQAGEAYTLTLPEDWEATEQFQGISTHYAMHVTPPPRLWLRSPTAQSAEAKPTGPLARMMHTAPPAPDGWPAHTPHQMAYQFPATIDLQVMRGNIQQTARFNLPSIPLRQWLLIPLRADDRVDFLISLLDEIVESTAPAAPAAGTMPSR
ncbi:MAG: hypothetical protein K2Q12_04220 [Rickettsiales bacterium]|nr:hypothetical protein [Rickettsiales bacterium]